MKSFIERFAEQPSYGQRPWLMLKKTFGISMPYWERALGGCLRGD